MYHFRETGHEGEVEGSNRTKMDGRIGTRTAGMQQQDSAIPRTTYSVVSFAFKPLFHRTDYLLDGKPQSFKFLIVRDIKSESNNA